MPAPETNDSEVLPGEPGRDAEAPGDLPLVRLTVCRVLHHGAGETRPSEATLSLRID
jgi:hypothetical protein